MSNNKKTEEIPKMNLAEKLSRIQYEFKANKSRFNSFGKYYFRSAEDILEALKPYNEKYRVYFLIEECLSEANNMPVITSRASILDIESDDLIVSSAIVGVDLQQKGMQVPQAYGSASSYGKKYALGNLLLIDDTQDSDATNTHGNSTPPPSTKMKLDIKDEAFQKAKDFIAKGGELSSIRAKYELTAAALKELQNI